MYMFFFFLFFCFACFILLSELSIFSLRLSVPSNPLSILTFLGSTSNKSLSLFPLSYVPRLYSAVEASFACVSLPFPSLPIVISKYLLSTRQTRQTPVLAGIHQRLHTIILATIDRPFLTPSSAHTATAVTPPTCVHPKTLSPPPNLDAPRHHSSPDPITPRSVARFIPSPVIAPSSKSAPTSHPKLNTKKSEFASPSALTKPPSRPLLAFASRVLHIAG